MVKVKINCIYNSDVSWCTNKNIKRSLFGVGARCCVLHDDKLVNKEKCEFYVSREFKKK